MAKYLYCIFAEQSMPIRLNASLLLNAIHAIHPQIEKKIAAPIVIKVVIWYAPIWLKTAQQIQPRVLIVHYLIGVMGV